MRNLLGVLLVGLLSGPGCGGDDKAGGAAGSPEEACNDVADAVGELCRRCGQSYDACRGAFISGLPKPCASAAQVKDRDLLYSTCLPSFTRVDCATLTNNTFRPDASCNGQILFPQ
jgi:hypothetical protein